MSLHHDIDGKESSKRKYAKKLVENGILMAWVAFGVSVFMSVWILIKEGTYKEIPTDLIYVQLLTGLGALGFTLGERVWGKKDNNNN